MYPDIGEILTHGRILRNINEWPFQNFYYGKSKIAPVI